MPASPNRKALAILNEGYRTKPYVDTVGKVTIGIGRNLTDVGISTDEINLFFKNDVKRAESLLSTKLPWTDRLDYIRYSAMLDMAFNMGGSLLEFKNSLYYMEKGNYEQAALNFSFSKWYQQVGVRGPRITNMISSGKWPKELENKDANRSEEY